MKVQIEIQKGTESDSWDECLQRNIDSLDWAIQNASAGHVASLMDTKSIICGIRSQLIPSSRRKL